MRVHEDELDIDEPLEGEPPTTPVPARDLAALLASLQALPIEGARRRTWLRAQGWCVSQALIALGYYRPESNPPIHAEATRWLAEVLHG